MEWLLANWKIIAAGGGIALVPLLMKYANKLDRNAWRKILLPLKPPLWGVGVVISKFLGGIGILKGWAQHIEDFLQVTVWNIICVLIQDYLFGGMDADDVKLTDIINPNKEKEIPAKPVPKAAAGGSKAKFVG